MTVTLSLIRSGEHMFWTRAAANTEVLRWAVLARNSKKPMVGDIYTCL